MPGFPPGWGLCLPMTLLNKQGWCCTLFHMTQLVLMDDMVMWHSEVLSRSYARRACRLILAVSDSPQPLDLLAQGPPALGIVLFSCLSYLPLNYIRSCLYTHLYDVARFPSLYIDLAPSPHLLPSNIIFISSSLEDVLSLPMDHTPIGSIPATGLWPSAVGSPLRGSG